MISYDVYNRTTSQKHRDCCQLIFSKSQQAGDIYLGSYEGWCVALLGASAQQLMSLSAGTTCARKLS